jgi:predicted extracellular nuclease/2',3'-cyclic-nucleotide 2'-phosphodiesterase (5'-nucleotidase family)
MTNVYHSLAGGPLSQNWTDASLISTNDDWSGVPSIIGYLGEEITGSTGVDPQTLTGDGTGVADVIANQTNPNTLSSGGVAEFAITNPTIALNGSGTADAPNIVLHLDATGRQNITVAFNARDLDGSADNAVQQIAVQYRVGSTGPWTNIPSGFVADATSGPSLATLVTPVSITLPAAVNNQSQVQVRIITANASGNDEWVGIDDIVADSQPISGGATVSINDVTIAEGDNGTTTATFIVTRSDNTGDFTVDYATADGTATAGSDYTAKSGTVSFTAGGALTQSITVDITGDTTVEPSETFAVNLSNIVNGTGNATIADTSGTGTIANDEVVLTKVSAIQGNSGNQTSNPVSGFDNVDGSPLRGQTVTIEAIVVGDFQNGDGDALRNLRGFYLQEEAADHDGDATTSEGIFIFEGTGNFLTDVAEGDRVRVTGVVQEDFGLTRIAATTVTVVQSGAVSDVSTMAVDINLPAAETSLSQEGTYQPDLEAFEGMLVRVPQTLTVTEQFDVDRFNEIKLYAGDAPGDRPAQYTHENAPSVAGYLAHVQDVGARTITYDDGLNTQNNPIGNLDGFGPTYNTANAVRMGDTVTNLTGVLDYQWAGAASSGATWRVRSIDNGDNTFADSTSPRQAEPADVGGRLTVGSFNVLNFFATLDDSSSSNNTPAVVGPNNLTPRGANDFNFNGSGSEPGDVGYVPDTREFDRQVAKLVNVIAALDADVLGLIELENNFEVGATGNAIEVLVDRLNAQLGSDVYDWLYPNQTTVGGDAISVGYIFKPGTVQVAPGTTVEILNDADLAGLGLSGLLGQSSVGGIFDGTSTSRNAIAVTWQEVDTGELFTTAANHFKSKGSAPATGVDADQLDGAGGWNNQRVLAATALASWLADDPTGTTDDDYIILGDLNSYFKEAPIALLEAAGYINLQAALLDNPYSYVFDGQIGALDYIMANSSLLSEITGITEWHINSDEADALDYNIDFGRDIGIFDENALVRVSDHDPLLIGLSLSDFASEVTIGDAVVLEGNAGTTTVTFTVSRDSNAGAFSVDYVTADISATTADGDYVLKSGTLQFTAGGALTQTFTVTVNGDTNVETDESFKVTLSNVVSTLGTATLSDAEAVAVVANDDTDTFTLQLLHFADGEAGLLASGTAPLLAALVDGFDDDYANTLILAGGDNFLPGPFLAAGTDATVAATHNKGNNPGAADIEIHNRIGVEASTIGNHEFDLGTNAFSDVIGDAAFPYLSANLNFSADGGISARYQETVGVGGLENVTGLARKIVPSAVVQKGGETIGLVGVTTQILETISSTGNVEVKGFAGDGSETNDMALLAAQLQPVINDLISQGVNKIILMAHLQQIQFEKALAPLLTGVDIILAAGSNTRLGDENDEAVAFPGHAADFADTYPILTAGADGKPTLIVNTDNEYTYLGRLVVDFDANGEILVDLLDNNVNGAYASTVDNVAEAWGLDPADVDSIADLEATALAAGTKGDGVQQITTAVQTVIEAKDGNVLGFTTVYLEGERNLVRNQETNLGNLTADSAVAALKDALDDDSSFIVGIKNGGGIRAQIGAVDVVTGDKNPPLANPDAGKPEGGVSQLDVENSLRFNNGLMAFDTTAQGLKAILEHGVASLGNQGRFPQVGGVSFAYDPDLPAGSRITSIGLIDADGTVLARIFENGAFSPFAPAKITMVTSNFQANGGDGYPIKANGENFRFLLNDGTLSGPVDEALNFTAAGVVPVNILGEQQALAEYLAANFGTPETAYNQADTAITLDTRIQNLNFRDDAVLEDAITGTAGKDNLVGTAAADLIDAGDSTDRVSGGDGNDVIFGGEGLNLLDGDAGDDIIIGGSGKDVIDGGEGNDLIDGGDGNNNVLDGGEGDDTIIGGTGNDVIRGGDGIDTVDYSGAGSSIALNLQLATSVSATEGADRVAGIENAIGSAFNDTIVGSTAANVLEGGAGNDTLSGGWNSDTLTGGDGDDTFLFNTGVGGASGFDTITDFETGVDTIALSLQIFRNAGAVGDLSVDAFTMGTAATTLAHRIIFDDATGELFYDRDGTGAGAAVKFAVLEPALDIANTDFSIVA